MAWTERQREMLQEMGIRLWAPVASAGVAASRLPAASAKPAPAATRAAPSSTAAPMPAHAAPVVAADERARSIAMMPWPALREAVAACTACGLCQGRRQTVFGVGHAQAHWMIVGEAPGEQEDLKGEPFVGAAGHLLDQHAARAAA